MICSGAPAMRIFRAARLVAFALSAVTAAQAQIGDGEAATQPSTLPASQPAVQGELPEDLLTRLRQADDFEHDFWEQPGFLELVRFVKTADFAPGMHEEPLRLTDWTAVLERPSEFRGRVLHVEGQVGRNKDPYRFKDHPELGWFSQMEISRPDQPIAITIVTTQSLADIALDSTIEFQGYFALVRTFYDLRKQPRPALVLVGRGPISLSTNVPRPAEAPRSLWAEISISLVVAALVLFWLMRRSIQRPGTRDFTAVRARRGAPMSLAEDLDEWAHSGESAVRDGADANGQAGRDSGERG